MLRFVLLTLFSVMSAMLAVPGSAAAGPLRVVTTIETFADLARQVGGANVQVVSLARGYQDPHFVEAKPSLLVPLSRADLLVHVGLDLEIGWLPPLVQGSRNARIQVGARGNLDAATAIDVRDVPTGKVDRGQGDIHARGNPHYWLPPVNALKVAKEIAVRLAELDPTHAADYHKNLQALGATFKGRAGGWARKAGALRGMKVVTYHKSWTYLSAWLGLREVGYVENKPGIPPDPKHLAQLILRMKAEAVRAVLIESFYNRDIAGQVADGGGAKLLVLPSDVGATTGIRSYVDLVDAVLDRLTTATQ
jgi:zinc/manganese transport system substrate-binding protein